MPLDDEWPAYNCPKECREITTLWTHYEILTLYAPVGSTIFCWMIPLIKKLMGEEVKRRFFFSFFCFLAYPSLPLPTAWLTDWPAVKGAFVSVHWRKANQILWLVCLREENGAPGMPSAAEMCRQSDCWGRLGLLWPFQNYARGITCLAHSQRDSFCKALWLFIYLFTYTSCTRAL